MSASSHSQGLGAPLPRGLVLAMLPMMALVQAAGPPPRPVLDLYGDPLPLGAVARLGSMRLRHGEQINSGGFTGDSRALASAGTDGYVRLWDTATGKLLGKHRGIAATPDGRAILSRDEGGPQQAVVLVDARTGTERSRFTGHTRGIL